MSTLCSRTRRIAPVALILSLLACDERSPSAPPSGAVPRELRVLNGDGQQAAAGAALPDELVVTAVDAAGRPLPGIPLRFAVVAGGGQTAPQAVTSDGRGFARTRWTLGTVAADSQVVEARADGVPSLRLRARAVSGTPAALVLSGGGAVGPVGTALADSLAVAVNDRFGNPVEGIEVGWEVAAGGGTVAPSRAPTRSDGTARARWILGPRVDSAQTVLARVPGFAPAAFVAHAVTRGAPLQLAKRGGDGQRGPAGTVLADSIAVVLRMPDGRPVVGAHVSWSVPPEAGTVIPAVSRTDSAGAASTSWRLGTAPGLVQATATVDEGTLVFTALVQAAGPARMVAVAGGGEGQVAAPLPDSLAVRVTDAYGNPVPGAEVEWAELTGGGQVQPARSGTDASGIARAQWTLGTLVGAQTARAALPGVPAVPFQATASTRGVPLRLARVAGDGQTGPVARALADSLVVELRTQAGVPVQGATVAWLALSGGGQVSPAASRTDGEGRARAAWTLGTAAGTATASARVDDGALAFSATALAGAPAAVRVLAGDGQSGTRGTILDDSLAVRVTDAWGNPVAGAQVSWTVHEGGGHLERQASTTNAAGVATTRWAVGFTPGENRAAASLDGGAGAPFTATGTAGTLTLSAVDRTRTTRPLMSTWRRQGPISAHVTDSQGRRAIGAPIQWESNENPAVLPATEWDTSSVATVDTWYGTWVPFPYSIAHFEGQRRVLNVPIWPTMYWVLDLPQGAGPYSANDSVAVVFRLVWDDTGINHGAEVPAPVQMHDDAGWTATTRTFVQVRWPLGSRTGSRKLTACLPEPYVFAEPYVTGCADVTITVVP